ncbi:MAG: hypothetical protein ACOCWB_01070 [Bacteroidota bacterium]
MENRFKDIIYLIKQSRKTAISFCDAKLRNIEENVSNKLEQSKWDNTVVAEFVKNIQQNEPEIKGFSDKNILENEIVLRNFQEFHKNLNTVERNSKEIQKQNINEY